MRSSRRDRPSPTFDAVAGHRHRRTVGDQECRARCDTAALHVGSIEVLTKLRLAARQRLLERAAADDEPPAGTLADRADRRLEEVGIRPRALGGAGGCAGHPRPARAAMTGRRRDTDAPQLGHPRRRTSADRADHGHDRCTSGTARTHARHDHGRIPRACNPTRTSAPLVNIHLHDANPLWPLGRMAFLA